MGVFWCRNFVSAESKRGNTLSERKVGSLTQVWEFKWISLYRNKYPLFNFTCKSKNITFCSTGKNQAITRKQSPVGHPQQQGYETKLGVPLSCLVDY